MTNVLVTAMLLTGGSAVVTSLTGVPTAAGDSEYLFCGAIEALTCLKLASCYLLGLFSTQSLGVSKLLS